jgi:hypothetical protein
MLRGASVAACLLRSTSFSFRPYKAKIILKKVKSNSPDQTTIEKNCLKCQSSKSTNDLGQLLNIVEIPF